MRSFIIAENVFFTYPIFNQSQYLLKNSLFNLIVNLKDHSHISYVEALKNLNFEIHAGERVAFSGHNGSGKTTLLKLISGIYEATNGKLRTSGSISSIFDLYSLINPDLSGYENLYIIGLLKGFNRSKMNNFIEEVINFSGIEKDINRPIKTYSNGMILRILYPAHTIIDCDILLIDEIINVGDSEFQMKANAYLQYKMNDIEIVIVSTHDNSIVNNLCNRKFEIKNGYIINDLNL